jgi:hypothetical protein
MPFEEKAWGTMNQDASCKDARPKETYDREQRLGSTNYKETSLGKPNTTS